ncbi:MAG: hypothetical protein ILO53_01370 [Clostridia bacterium]|nr:hypothetical protein [Clostridia bacterium]
MELKLIDAPPYMIAIAAITASAAAVQAGGTAKKIRHTKITAPAAAAATDKAVLTCPFVTFSPAQRPANIIPAAARIIICSVVTRRHPL